MAKKASKGVAINVAVLTAIANAADGVGRVSQADGVPLVNEGLIEVNTNDVDTEGKALARVTDKGKQYLSNLNSGTNESKPMFGIMKNVPIPESKRGNRKGAGAPTQYPFETMEVGDSFFVGSSVKADAAKKLGSTVSQQNMKYRTPTGQTETKEVTKRGKGNKAELNPDGTKVKETKNVPVYKQDRKYVLRAVKSGDKLGDWVAPEDGALIAREI